MATTGVLRSCSLQWPHLLGKNLLHERQVGSWAPLHGASKNLNQYFPGRNLYSVVNLRKSHKAKPDLQIVKLRERYPDFSLPPLKRQLRWAANGIYKSIHDKWPLFWFICIRLHLKQRFNCCSKLDPYAKTDRTFYRSVLMFQFP